MGIMGFGKKHPFEVILTAFSAGELKILCLRKLEIK
jgi:hypothetical protein